MLSAPGQKDYEDDRRYVLIGEGLFKQIIDEQQVAEAYSLQLAHSMRASSGRFRERLDGLSDAIHALGFTDSTSRGHELHRNVKGVIGRLTQELEELAKYAASERLPVSRLRSCFDIGPIIDRVAEDWRREAREKRVRLQVKRTYARVESEPYLLSLIINNLVANAVRNDLSEEVWVECLNHDGRLVVEVWIRTSVMMEADSERDDSGLSMIRGTAALLGHNLDTDIVLNQGTYVRLHVPFASPSSFSDSLSPK